MDTTAAQVKQLEEQELEALLNALMGYRNIMAGLNDRFAQKMALLEDSFAKRRAAIRGAAAASPVRARTAELDPQLAPERALPRDQERAAHLSILQEEIPDSPVESMQLVEAEPLFEPTQTEDFTLHDFEDDDF